MNILLKLNSTLNLNRICLKKVGFSAAVIINFGFLDVRTKKINMLQRTKVKVDNAIFCLLFVKAQHVLLILRQEFLHELLLWATSPQTD